MMHIKIILADDHKLVRQGVRSLLEAQPGFEVIGEASDGQEAYKLIETLSPDIAFLDVMMPNLNGIETAKLVRQRELKTKIIFLSMHANATYAVRALQSGALGYVLKDSDFSEVLNAVEHVMEGRRYLSTAIADEVLEMLLNAEAGKDETLDLLSPREREILQLVAEGNSNAAIADKLSLSVRTVESHRLNLTKKLRITSHADLVKFAINQGLITS
ncbi:MAG: response regulator transcription factor [Anaerolineales bacterium]|jgi:DNA-binding NarL/FixJ family response regulator|uniref:response regulator transcription factor n=1 Tax=Candidatus Villigracilis affinis TaxID=3140682 RepID=UPI001B40FC67|nr:response regulator transcription factor [Anaerolineales bacterium]MBK9601875.1 response regulator transcription factor [Anaerolineales bacterium]MBL0345623.1 response regulator transcription factor [Anaerolineales bacterium]MBP8047940.1 response regulator transcription factor [Anaerolineales bacterium]